MSDRRDLPEDLLALLDEYCNDVIDEERLRALKAYLLADEAARREFVAYFHLHTEMQFAVRARRAADSVLAMIDDEPRRRGPGRWGWWAATAAAILLVGLGALLWPRGRREAPAPAPSWPKVGIASGLAMVIKLDGVRWEPDGAPHPSEGDLLASGHFRFRSGRATLSMLSGVSLVVEGPADVELIAHDKVVCHRGRLRARVPEGAEGFVASGPGSAVVDMGTEFGMNVEDDGKTRGKVFEGMVEAAVLNEAGACRRSQLMDEGSNAFRIDPGTGRIETDASPGDFVAPSTLAARPLVLDAGYRDAILRSGPWGYWRFDSAPDGVIPNEVPGRPPLRLTGPIGLSKPARGNAVAVFGDGQTGQYVSLDGSWEPARNPGFAIEMWFLPERIGHLALASMFADDPLALSGEKPSSLQFQFILELTSSIRTKYRLHQPASVRLLHRFPAGWSGGDNLYSNEPYVPYRWHHLVGQMNGDRMELFLDGNPTPPLAVDPAYSNKPSRLLLGRLTAIPEHSDDTSRPFVGRMDEVALYDRPLTVEEIRSHHRMADLRTAAPE
jgi:hypothetical protein